MSLSLYDQIQCFDYILKNSTVDLNELKVKECFQLDPDIKKSFLENQRLKRLEVGDNLHNESYLYENLSPKNNPEHVLLSTSMDTSNDDLNCSQMSRVTTGREDKPYPMSLAFLKEIMWE